MLDDVDARIRHWLRKERKDFNHHVALELAAVGQNRRSEVTA